MTENDDNRAMRTRLTVLFASAAPKAVILRRGPKTHWHLIVWDLETDTFTHGQWMKGLVKLWDLSPRGDKLIYWAAQYHRRAISERSSPPLGPFDPLRAAPVGQAKQRRKTPRYLRAPVGLRRSPHPVTATWTAISSPPYFTALAIWPAYGHWTGDGVFQSDHEIFVREPETRMVPIERIAIPPRIRTRSLPAVSLKRCARGPSHGENPQDGAVWQGLVDGGAKWVEWVHLHSKGDLLFACDGRIYRLHGWRDLPAERYLAEAQSIADFNDMRFQMLSAPREAMRW
jgi:hypothetical protein